MAPSPSSQQPCLPLINTFILTFGPPTASFCRGSNSQTRASLHAVECAQVCRPVLPGRNICFHDNRATCNKVCLPLGESRRASRRTAPVKHSYQEIVSWGRMFDPKSTSVLSAHCLYTARRDVFQPGYI